MKYNGTIAYLIVSQEVTIDEFGEPIDGTTEWSDEFSCSIKTLRDNRIYRTGDGIERMTSYSVLIPATSAYDWKARTKVRLKRNGETLGEFEVITSEIVPNMGRIRIDV